MSDFQKAVFRPMSDYDRHNCHPAIDDYCGPSALVRFLSAKAWPRGYAHFVAHLDDDEWYAHEPLDPGYWQSLDLRPVSWMPIPDVCLRPAERKQMPALALTVQMEEHPKAVFRAISEYPRDTLSGADCYWGPEVLVRVPPSHAWPHGTTYFVAQLDGRDWIASRDHETGRYQALHGKPDAWMPIPDVFLRPARNDT